MSTASNRDFRPAIHFTPEKNWMNDPNGMVYVDGQYHLLYQYYPYDTVWGPMHWGHAVSRDLLHWQHLPIALYPDELGMIFSGSMVYDSGNTSGYEAYGRHPYVAVYTSHGENGLEQQSIAYSTDGIHFEKSYLNPVIPNPGISDFRDPKVFWNPVRQCWSLVLAAQTRVMFYASPDLKHWEKTGEFGPGENHVDSVWECPDMIPIIYKDTTVWCLIASMTSNETIGMSRTQYFLGTFDGDKFINSYPSDQPMWLDDGIDNYAAVSFANYEDPMIMGWGMNWEYAGKTPTNEYCGQATLARILSIAETKDGLRLVQKPDGLASYRKSAYAIDNNGRIAENSFGLKVKGSGRGKLELKNSRGQIFRILFEEDKVIFDRSLAGMRDFHDSFMEEKFSVVEVERKKNGNWEMELIFDVSIMEAFLDGGLNAVTLLAYPDIPYDRVRWTGDMKVKYYRIYK